MADILIRGIEFPQCCGDCPFQASRWTGDFCSAGQFMFDIDFDYRDKHKKCPIVPFPERHGRLIDANELELDLVRHNGAIGLELIGNAPTIVPAEGGREDG